jgi:hypothetical protein
MFRQRTEFSGFGMSLAGLVLLGCSGGGGAGDGGGASGLQTDSAIQGGAGNSQTDGNIQGGTGGVLGGPDSASDTANCTLYSPAIFCAQGTTCPTDSYCDLTQSPSVCAKRHLR